MAARLDPNPIRQIELRPLRVEYFATSSTGQQQQTDGVRALLLAGLQERVRQSGYLVGTKVAPSFGLVVSLDAGRRIVAPQAGADSVRFNLVLR